MIEDHTTVPVMPPNAARHASRHPVEPDSRRQPPQLACTAGPFAFKESS